MNLEEKIINLVVENYITSRDFNGLPINRVLEEIPISEKEIKQKVRKLIIEGKLSISLYVNPYIRAFEDPIGRQIDFLENENLTQIVIYPTSSILKQRIDKEKYKDKPFSRMLLEGYPQLYPCYFSLDVLERYKNDPRYYLRKDGTNLSLSIKDEFYFRKKIPEEDKILIQNFGYAYSKETGQKVIMVFLRDLHNLSSKHQKYWESYQIRGDFVIDNDYLKSNLLAKFIDYHSVYEAFLEEEKQINIIAKIMGKPPLFRKEYEYESLSDFGDLPKPTKKIFSKVCTYFG
jgi:DNA-binding Lrp family transcriptional regulator